MGESVEIPLSCYSHFKERIAEATKRGGVHQVDEGRST